VKASEIFEGENSSLRKTFNEACGEKTIPSVESVVEEMIEDAVAQMELWQENEVTVKEFSANLRNEYNQTLTQRDQAIKEALLESLEGKIATRDTEGRLCVALDDIKEIINKTLDV